MADLKFSLLSYYPSILNDENINVGMLFYCNDPSYKFFYLTKNLKRLASFDDELDIAFMKDYLLGIKEQWEKKNTLNDECSVDSFIYNYGNELRFGKIQSVNVEDIDSFVSESIRMNFRFDYDKKDRPNDESVRKFMVDLLKKNGINYTNEKVSGGFGESVIYDFVVDRVGFKSVTLGDDGSIRRKMMTIKGWAYTAMMNKEANGLDTVFVVDSETNNSAYQQAQRILRQNAVVLKPSEILSYIQNMVSNNK